MKIQNVILSLSILMHLQSYVLGQAVNVSVSLSKTNVTVGESVKLTVYAQIVAEKRASTDRIFSWNIDLLNLNPGVAGFDISTLAKAASDKDPATSSVGSLVGGNIRGITDTFINLSGAGRETPVELLSISVQAVATGTVTIAVEAGTAPGLFGDFLVAPLGGGENPLVGGIYSNARTSFQVGGGGSNPFLGAILNGSDFTLSFVPKAGINHYVESRADLNPLSAWSVLPGAPHNSGKVIDRVSGTTKFYRLRVGD